MSNSYPRCDRITATDDFCCARKETVLNMYKCVANSKEATSKLQIYNLFLNILKNSNFIYAVVQAKKMAREYYNRGKNYCTVLNMNQVKGGSGKLTLYLNSQVCNREIDFSKRTYLMRVAKGLPTLWSCPDKKSTDGVQYPNKPLYCNQLNQNLSTNEKIAHQYMKHSAFFLNVLSAFKYATVNYAEFKNYCRVFDVPKEFTTGCTGGIKAKFTGQELKMIYCLYLRNTPLATKSRRLPNPLTNC
jgi:hypothetical protein